MHRTLDTAIEPTEPVPLMLPTNKRGLRQAVELIRSGRPIGASFGSVFGVVGNGTDERIARQVAQIKGSARIGKPLSVCIPDERFAGVLEPMHIHPDLRDFAVHGLVARLPSGPLA